MSKGLCVNQNAEWQYECLAMIYNSNVETGFDGAAAVTGKGFVLEKYEEIDWQSCYIFVQTVESTGAKTVDVGILSSEGGGDANGLIAAASTATLGWVRPTWTVTQATSDVNYISASTMGDLFLKGTKGTSAGGHNAIPLYQNYIGDGTAKTLTYTCATTSASFVGFFWFRHRRLPDLTNFLVK